MTDDASKLNDLGYCGPFSLMNFSPDDRALNFIDDLKGLYKDRHLDCATVRQLFNDPNLISKVSESFGNGLILWRTNFFLKDDGQNAKEIRWHHDKHFQSGDDDLNFSETEAHFSIFIALKDVTKSNGMLEMLAGSHKQIEGFDRDVRPYHRKDVKEHFVVVPEGFRERVVQLEVKAGQFILFHSALLHRSLPYQAGPSRVAVIGRLVRDNVVLPQYLGNASALMRFS